MRKPLILVRSKRSPRNQRNGLTVIRAGGPVPFELYALDHVAHYLNANARGGGSEIGRKIESIVSGWLFGDTAAKLRACEEFNVWAKEVSPPLAVYWDPKWKEPAAQVGGGVMDGDESALYTLWEFFFKERGRDRLKLCAECDTWFVDGTKGKVKVRCSRTCTNKHWTRERRQGANHGKAKRRASR
jgi:hypothetical protein